MTTDTAQIKRALGIFSSRQKTLQALDELKNTGFPMEKISVITKNTAHDEQISNADKRKPNDSFPQGAASGAIAGGAIGGSLILAGGLVSLLVPGVGPAIAAETLLVTLLGTGSTVAAGGLIGALNKWSVPKEDAQFYSDKVSQGNYLVTIEGTENEIRRAEVVCSRWGIQKWQIVDAPTDSDRLQP